MENKSKVVAKVSRSVKAKRQTPAAKARREMIKEAAMKFSAFQRKYKVPTRKKVAAPVAVKKARKPRFKKIVSEVAPLAPMSLEQTLANNPA
jgi:hypothetical protein